MKPPTTRHPDHRDQEGQHVGGQVQLVAEAGQDQRQQRRDDRGERVPGQPAPQRQAAADPGQPPAAAHLRVRDDVHVDVAGPADGAHADPGPGQQGAQPAAAADAEHQLGGVLGAGEVQQGGGHVLADDLVVAAAQRLGQPPLRGQRGRVGPGQPVGPGDVHGQQVPAGGPGGDPGRPPDQRLALGTAGQRDHHPLAGLPGALDAVLGPVALQPLVDLVGQPEQGQLAQRGEVAGPEVVGQRRVDLLGRVDVAVRHPAAQRLGGHVDELDLLGGADHRVRHGLPLRHAGDLLHHVVQRLQVLDVQRGDDVDPGGQQLLHVLPALGVLRPRHVGVRELVDQRDLRVAGQHRGQVHLLEHRAAVADRGPRDDLQPGQQRRGVHPPVRLGERHHQVGASFLAPVALVEHGVRLAGPGRRGKVDPQPAPAVPARAAVVVAELHRIPVRARIAISDHMPCLTPGRGREARLCPADRAC